MTEIFRPASDTPSFCKSRLRCEPLEERLVFAVDWAGTDPESIGELSELVEENVPAVRDEMPVPPADGGTREEPLLPLEVTPPEEVEWVPSEEDQIVWYMPWFGDEDGDVFYLSNTDDETGGHSWDGAADEQEWTREVPNDVLPHVIKGPSDLRLDEQMPEERVLDDLGEACAFYPIQSFGAAGQSFLAAVTILAAPSGSSPSLVPPPVVPPPLLAESPATLTADLPQPFFPWAIAPESPLPQFYWPPQIDYSADEAERFDPAIHTEPQL